MKRLVVITPEVKVRPNHGRLRSTVHDVKIIWDGFLILIAHPFEFDGASIPFFLWWWARPWLWWVVLAACVHDFLYRHRWFTRKECDVIFLRLLCYSARKSRWKWLAYRRMLKARVMYRAVRICGAAHAGADW